MDNLFCNLHRFGIKNSNKQIEFKDEIKIENINLPVKCRQGITNWQGKKYIEDVKYSCRIYPQDNDIEGFFIAKFRKLE